MRVLLEGRAAPLFAAAMLAAAVPAGAQQAQLPPDLDCAPGNDPDTLLISGGPAIVSPIGEVFAGPYMDGFRDATLQNDRPKYSAAHGDGAGPPPIDVAHEQA